MVQRGVEGNTTSSSGACDGFGLTLENLELTANKATEGKQAGTAKPTKRAGNGKTNRASLKR